MMMGFHEASGLEYDIKFSIGIVLIIIILIALLHIVPLEAKSTDPKASFAFESEISCPEGVFCTSLVLPASEELR